MPVMASIRPSTVTTPEKRSEGVTRTVFGLLNALPLAGAIAALKGEGRVAESLHDAPEPSSESSLQPLTDTALQPVSAPALKPPATRLELMRGVCAPFASFSDEVLAQIARVSTVNDDMLRLMQAGRPPTPLLADTIARFKLDQELEATADPTTRASLFNARYQALQHSDHEWVRLFQREYPGLPKAVVEQILDRSGVEIEGPVDAAEAARVLRRLDDKAREYQQHVRLNRAYEGLYLRSIVHPESDVLALHSLARSTRVADNLAHRGAGRIERWPAAGPLWPARCAGLPTLDQGRGSLLAFCGVKPAVKARTCSLRWSTCYPLKSEPRCHCAHPTRPVSCACVLVSKH